MKKAVKFTWHLLGALCFPVYLAYWVFHEIARLLLAISYFGMFEKQVGKDIISSLFNWHGRH